MMVKILYHILLCTSTLVETKFSNDFSNLPPEWFPLNFIFQTPVNKNF